VKKETRQRIVIACLGVPLSALGAFVGGGLAAWAFSIYKNGLVAPDFFGWSGTFIVCGVLLALLPATPSLLTMVMFHVY